MKSNKRKTNQKDVILYDEKVLKVLAKVIADYFSVPKITEILILKNVPESKICNSEDGSEILLEVFLGIKKKKIIPRIENKVDEITLSGERYISRIIEDFIYPLSHFGDANKVKEFSEKIQNIITHDNLACYRFGKSFRIFEKGEYEIAKELEQESLQENNIDLLRDNDEYAYLITSNTQGVKAAKKHLVIWNELEQELTIRGEVIKISKRAKNQYGSVSVIFNYFYDDLIRGKSIRLDDIASEFKKQSKDVSDALFQVNEKIQKKGFNKVFDTRDDSVKFFKEYRDIST